ncbi:MAG: SRPBCC family protein [Candidatus Latescibacterota bacterium]|nr:SRPBCC family protein [Candidatus Latescibacterota bacterium]
MRLHQLKRTQRLPITIEEAWGFFSEPGNLAEITPPELGLQVTSDLPEEIHLGMIVSYTLRPLLSIRLTWVTEISSIEKPIAFVDEQRVGPYRFWHHLHQFESVPGGVEIRDTVSYVLPFGWIGSWFHGVFVRRDLENIFDYRYNVLNNRFGRLAS